MGGRLPRIAVSVGWSVSDQRRIIGVDYQYNSRLYYHDPVYANTHTIRVVAGHTVMRATTEER